MSKVRVKICGLKSVADIQTAVHAGADAVGFVVDVPESPRNLSVEDAERLMRFTPVFVEPVVVTVPKDINHLQMLFRRLKPRILQVHGSGCSQDEIKKNLPDVHLIRAVDAGAEDPAAVAKPFAEESDAVILDTYIQGKHGGTGVTHDWILSRCVKEAVYPKPLVLAGGLHPGNVGDAIRAVQPYAVDVSSGVESKPGVKDPLKVHEFIKNAKEVEL